MLPASSAPATAAPLDKAHPDFDAWLARFTSEEHARHGPKAAHHVARALAFDVPDPDTFPPAPTTTGAVDPYLHQRQEDALGFKYVSAQLLTALADPARVAAAFRTLALANTALDAKKATPRNVVEVYRRYWSRHRAQGFAAFAHAYRTALAVGQTWSATTSPADALNAVVAWRDALAPEIAKELPDTLVWRTAAAAYTYAHPAAATTLLTRPGASKANQFDPTPTAEGFVDAAEQVHALADEPLPAALAGGVKRSGGGCIVCAAFAAANPTWKPAQPAHDADTCHVLQAMSTSTWARQATATDGVFARLVIGADGRAALPPPRPRRAKERPGNKPAKDKQTKKATTTALAAAIQGAMNDGLLHEDFLVFDTGCEAHVLNGRGHTLPVEMSDAEASVQGFGGPVAARQGTHPVLGDVLIAPEAPCSLFSHGQAVADGWTVSMADGFTARKDDNVLVFKPLQGRKLYVYAPSLPRPEAYPPRPAAFTVGREPTQEARGDEAGGVEGRMSGEDKLQQFLRIQHAALGHHPFAALPEVLTSKHARVDLPRGATLTSLRAAARQLQCTDCLVGGSTRHVVRNEQEAADAKCFPVGSAIEVDFVFAGAGQDLPCLFAVELATGFLFLRPLSSRTAPRVLEAVMSIRDELASMDHGLKLVRSDSEPVLLTLHAPLAQRGILYQPYPPGVHATQIERNVRTLKTRLRVLLASADARGIRYPQRVRPHLFAYGVASINATPSVHTAGSGMPRSTALTGKPVVLDKAVGFGDFVITHEPEEKTRPWDQPRAHLGMVVSAPLDGSSSIDVLDLGCNDHGVVTGRVHRRVQWTRVADEPWMRERVKLLPPMSVPEFASDVAPQLRLPPLVVTGVRPAAQPPTFTSSPAPPATAPSPALPATAVQPHPAESSPAPPATAAQPHPSESSPATPATATHPPAPAPAPRLADVVPRTLPTTVEQPVAPRPQAPTAPSGPLSQAVQAAIPPPPPPAPTPEPVPENARPRRSSRVDHDYAHADVYGFFAASDGSADTGVAGVLRAFMAEERMTDLPTHLPTLRQQYPAEYAAATRAELGKLLELGVFEPADPAQLPSAALRYQTARLKLVAKWGRDFTGAHRLKVRAVAGGDELERKAQWRGADENAPLPAAAPTITPLGLMMFLVLACVHRRFLVFFDVNSAYLHAEQSEEDDDVYLYLPREVAEVVVEMRPEWRRFVLSDGRLLMHVRRAIYGLRRSGRLWFERLMKLLLAFGFQPADTQPAFLLKHGDQAAVIYVDDGILQVPRQEDATPFIQHLNNNLQLGIKTKQQTPHRFLGVDIWQSTDRSFATVAQTHLIDEIVDLLKVTPAQHKRVPAPPDVLSKGLLEGPPADARFYASVVQKANYLWTRPDILFTLRVLQAVQTAPTEAAMKALRHLGGYLAATRTHGIVIYPNGPLHVTAFCDAAHGLHEDARGHGGTVVLLANTPVCTTSRKLSIVTDSSTAAETLQIANAIPNVLAARELLESTGAIVPTSILNVDCKPAITTCVNGFGKVAHKRALAVRVAAVKAELVEKTSSCSGSTTRTRLPTSSPRSSRRRPKCSASASFSTFST